MSYSFHIHRSTQFNFWNPVGTQTNYRDSGNSNVERAVKQAQLGSNKVLSIVENSLVPQFPRV